MARRETLTLGFADQLEKVRIELPDGEPRPWDATSELSVVGTAVPRIDGSTKVTGEAPYTFDVVLPGMLYAAVLRSPHPAAVVEAIDIAPASRVPGVEAVLEVAKVGDKLLFAGQDVAAVAATRPEIARQALAKIAVTYAERPFVVDLEEAMQDGAPAVHEGGVEERRTEGDEPGTAGGKRVSTNVRALRPMSKGSVERGMARADVRHEASYFTQVVTHAALETHGMVVRWDSAKAMTVWCSTQSIFSVRDEMAEVFELEPSAVHVITEALGGGFGAKFGASAPGSRLGFIAGELARQAKAPVKLMLDRHEEHVCTGNRPDSRQDVRLGATRSGRLLAIEVVSHGTAGIGTGAGVGRNAFAIYSGCPNIEVRAHDVFTHAGPGTAMRAPGHPQGAFALELALDELATEIGIDPLELRLQHDEHPVRQYQLREGRERFGWDELRRNAAERRADGARLRRGAGAALSIWGDFGRANAAVVTVSVNRDGTLEVKNGVQDIGSGIPTVMAQVVAEVFHRPVDAVRVRFGDSELGPSVGSGGSQTTSSVTPAVRNAAEQAHARLQQLAAKALDAAPTDVTWDAQGNAVAAGKTIEFGQLCRKIDGEAIVATATRPETYGAHPMRFMDQLSYQIAGVQFAEVEVDTWTGLVRVPRILALHDCGRVMNELTLRSQINGGIVMGTSYALTEQRVMDKNLGRMLNANLDVYKIAGFKETPAIDIVLTEVHTGANSTGAVGIGEPATIPTAAAIANAVYDALGIPIRSLPLTPDKVLDALAGATSTLG